MDKSDQSASAKAGDEKMDVVGGSQKRTAALPTSESKRVEVDKDYREIDKDWMKETLMFSEAKSEELVARLKEAGLETVGLLRKCAMDISKVHDEFVLPRDLQNLGLLHPHIRNLYDWAQRTNSVNTTLAQQFSSLLSPTPYPSNSTAYPRNLEIASVASSALASAQFPLPATVSSASFGFVEDLKVKDVPRMPSLEAHGMITNNPYMLIYTMEHDPDLAQRRTNLANKMNDLGSTILFGTSGCGKTLLLQSLLSTQLGSLLVLFPENTKNFGTRALTEVVSLLGKRFRSEAWFMDKDDASERDTSNKRANRRDEAEHAIRCVLVAHLLVKQEWEKIHGPVTPKQWLLLQLHPTYFFRDNLDWIADLAVELYKNAKPDRIEKVRMPIEWIVALDEAQLLQDRFTEMFQSSVRNSLRALLSPTLAAIRSVGSRALLAGSGLRMMEAFKSGESNVAARGINVVNDFPRLSKDHIKQQLMDLFNEQDFDPALAEAAEWLFGRGRLFTLFVEYRRLFRHLSLKAAIDAYVKDMTTNTADTFTIASHINRILASRQTNKTFHSWVDQEIVTVKYVSTAFENAAWDAFNGTATVKVPRNVGVALVEYGLAPATTKTYVDIVFEPLVLQAMFVQVFSTVDFMERRLNAMNSTGSTSLGLEFEKLIPSLLLPALFASDRMNTLQDMFPLSPPPAPAYATRSAISASSGPPQPLQEWWRGVWRWSPRFGAVASASYPFDVWLTAFMQNSPVAAAGCYPDNLAGPDYVTSLVRWEMNEQTGTWSPTMDRALVLVQIKLTATLGVENAKLTVDPQFVYCKNRKSRKPNPYKKHKAKRLQLLDIVKTVPVIRIVVSGVTDGVSTMEIVETNRKDGRYTHDVLMVLQGTEMNRFLGVQVAQALRELKCVAPDESMEEAEEEE